MYQHSYDLDKVFFTSLFATPRTLLKFFLFRKSAGWCICGAELEAGRDKEETLLEAETPPSPRHCHWRPPAKGCSWALLGEGIPGVKEIFHQLLGRECCVSEGVSNFKFKETALAYNLCWVFYVLETAYCILTSIFSLIYMHLLVFLEYIILLQYYFSIRCPLV